MKKNKLKWWQWLLIVLATIWTISFFAADETEEEKAQRIAIEEADALQEKRADDLIAAYLIAKDRLLESLKDPESYDEIEESHYYIDEAEADPNTYIQVKIKYRATNSFGAYIQSQQCFNLDKIGNITDSFECN